MIMTYNDFNPKKALLITRLLFIAIFGASLAFIIIITVLLGDKLFFRFDSSDIFGMTPYLIFILSVPTGYYISKQVAGKVNSANSLKEKYQVYQSALIIRLAVCEGSALYSVIYMLVTNNMSGIIPAFMALMIMVLNYPIPERASRFLNLSDQETEQLIQ
jgi:hypothetical protein